MTPFAHNVLRTVSVLVLIGLTLAPKVRSAVRDASRAESERVVSER